MQASRFAAVRVRFADGPDNGSHEYLPSDEGWLVCERSMFDQHKLDDRRAYLLKTETGGASWRRIEATGSDLTDARTD